LFVALLAMGAMNYRALDGRIAVPSQPRARRADGRGSVPGRPLSLCRRVEVEAGLAIVTLFLAASIGSAPPAVDGGEARATLGEIRRVVTPEWPRLRAPTLVELDAATALGDSSVPHTSEETAWSEFGHHIAGLFVLAIALLAALERTGRAAWAR